jgi:hypothetical protein
LYAVWQDASFNNGQADAIAFSQSLNGGRTRSSPIKVNKTPTGQIGNQQAFTASVDVLGDGTIHLLRLPQQHTRDVLADGLLRRPLPSAAAADAGDGVS